MINFLNFRGFELKGDFSFLARFYVVFVFDIMLSKALDDIYRDASCEASFHLILDSYYLKRTQRESSNKSLRVR